MNIYRFMVHVVFVFIASTFYGYSILSLVNDNMADWYIITCIILSCGLINYLIDSRFFHKKRRIVFSKQQYHHLVIGLFLSMSFSTYFATNQHLSFALLSLQTALIGFSYCCYIGLKETSYKLEYGYFLLVLAPLMTLVWLPPSYYFHLTRGWNMQWHGAFVNIRFYDDIMLPLVFLLWFQPKWLKTRSEWVFILSTFYLFSLWVDGARAVWISIFLTLLIFLFAMRGYFKQAIRFLWIPISSIVTSWLIYLLITNLFNDTSHGIARTSSSLRLPMWLECWDIWLSHPILGVGGWNYQYYGTYLASVGDPHNLIVQQVMDWGIAGIMFILLTCFYLRKIAKVFFVHIRQHDFINSFLIKEKYIFVYMSVLAAFINSVMSASYFYPYVQLLMCVMIAQVFVIFNKIQEKTQ